MAANTDQRNEIRREVYHGTNVHMFAYRYPVRNLGEKQSWTFEEDFNTECQSLPTSWSCKISFQKVSDGSAACIPFSLKRTDSGDDSVKVYFSLYIKDAALRPLFDTPLTRIERLSAGDVLEDSVIETFQLPKLRSDFNLKLNVAVTIDVSYCHSENNENS
ncbi:hypothetical protein HNY73_013870 [Argiope bruennichi]|uniref:Uncharacterized protein n=1 Tax=Argiope bruennichi TaxID=94029 RepID=A0A8T0ER50_ARGBR|nr:hypothetical protein HNY73_013870 [Argiope bruennichi]